MGETIVKLFFFVELLCQNTVQNDLWTDQRHKCVRKGKTKEIRQIQQQQIVLKVFFSGFEGRKQK